MRILVIGSGGREHALCWKIARSGKLEKLYCAPGNGGISEIAECVDILPEDTNALLEFAKNNSIDITIVGPEAPLTAGIVDIFIENGLKIFGPDKISAQLEASKIFAKEAMKRFGISTADFRVFDNPHTAKVYINSKTLPLVIKADGLCAGKGVVIANTKEEAMSAIDSMMIQKAFGSAGEKIIVEECLHGEEASVILISDGKDYILFPSSQDHKRVFDNDKGSNTGGMGAYSPAPVVTDSIISRTENEIIKPLLEGLKKEKAPYKGVLYIGLMIANNKPHVLEFNVRFGDPETQAILPRLKTDLIDIIEKAVDEDIKNVKTVFDARSCVCVVLSSQGYPGSYKKGIPINGMDKISFMDDVFVFHAGTKLMQTANLKPQTATNGGRVLGVTAIAEDIKSAITRAYEAVGLINFEGMHYRRDIGRRAIVSSKL
jgi:phosphoribosylamine---glycine ligase